jgi:hypothetical protein
MATAPGDCSGFQRHFSRKEGHKEGERRGDGKEASEKHNRNQVIAHGRSTLRSNQFRHKPFHFESAATQDQFSAASAYPRNDASARRSNRGNENPDAEYALRSFGQERIRSPIPSRAARLPHFDRLDAPVAVGLVAEADRRRTAV